MMVRDCEQRLIGDHKHYLCDNVNKLYESGRYSDFRTMYMLMEYVDDGIELMIKAIQERFMKIARRKLRLYKRRYFNQETVDRHFLNDMRALLEGNYKMTKFFFFNDSRILRGVVVAYRKALALS